MMSHPSRVRGLKQLIFDGGYQVGVSHPSRVRGLKQGQFFKMDNLTPVAPLAGAWIET